MIRLIFVAVLAGSVAGASVVWSLNRSSDDIPAPAHYGKRVEILERWPPSGAVAVVGDSLVDLGPWRGLTDGRAANYGIAGDTIARLRARWDRVEPARRIVWVGINDVIAGRNVDDILADFRAFLEGNHDRQMAVMAIGPVRGMYGPHNPRIAAINAGLQAMCSDRCRFIDTWRALALNGELDARFSEDGVHLNAAGYAALKPLVRELL